jgi:hypothetical protein
MAMTSKVFPVEVDNERASLAFDMRAAVVDFLRSRVALALSRAEDAGIDKQTALRRFSLTFAGAAKGFRLPRTVPGSLVNWAAYAEINKTRADFPTVDDGDIGTFDKECVTTLPGDIMLVKMGGVTFAGVCPGGKPEDLFEVRIGKDEAGKYHAVFVCGRIDGDDRIGIPTPVEPEAQDA